MMSCWRRVLSVLLMLTILVGPSIAQEAAPQSAISDIPLIPKGEKENRITDKDKIPPQLMAAIKAAGCNLDLWLPHVPVHVFRIEKWGIHRPIALVPCFGIVAFSKAFIFHQPSQQPSPMIFPVVDGRQGISMTFTPGSLSWNETDQVLVATLGSDMCPDMWFRYTYRFERQTSRQEAPLSWVLMKAEAAQNVCAERPDGWKTFFETPAVPAKEPVRRPSYQ